MTGSTRLLALAEAVERAADELVRCASRVAAEGVRLERDAATCVWHAGAADAFRAQMARRRLRCDEVAAELADAARRLHQHADVVRRTAALLDTPLGRPA
jgi:hypothetical protein